MSHSGKIVKKKVNKIEDEIRPNKAYDPHQLFRQRHGDNPMTKLTQRIEDVVEEEKTFPDKQKGDRFKELKKYLKRQ